VDVDQESLNEKNTSVNNVVTVQKVDGTQHLADDVGCLRLLNELFVQQQFGQVASLCSNEWASMR
jgi:hypothetical protein